MIRKRLKAEPRLTGWGAGFERRRGNKIWVVRNDCDIDRLIFAAAGSALAALSDLKHAACRNAFLELR